MKLFKIEATRNAPAYEITKENFENTTMHKLPFELINLDGSVSEYGICPSCLNPIQIIGLVKKVKVKPYGKHTGKNVENLRDWDQTKYEYCPYATKQVRREINDDELLPEITEDIIELYDLLKNNFDRVVYVVSNALDIRCSSSFWKKALRGYLANNVYCYPWLTENNLPYIFAFVGMRHYSAHKQQFRVGSDVFKALEAYPNVKFSESSCDRNYKILTNDSGFLNLQFRLWNHKQEAVEGELLKESMHFCIDDLSNGKVTTVFEKKIDFDEKLFMNLVRSKNNTYRNQKLLDIATELMKPLELSSAERHKNI